MNSKAITPLIAWVLLVGFAVAIGMLVTQWALEEFKNLDYPTNVEEACDNVQINIENICLDQDKVLLNISNKGHFSIKRFTIGRETNYFSEEWCTMLNLNLAPGEEIQKSFLAGSNNDVYSNIAETDCTILPGGQIFDVNHKLIKLDIVPWIEINEEIFHCKKREILLNDIVTLNTECS